jgi:hypothetical protein
VSKPYLIEHPPVRTQFRPGRRAEPTGAIVVHDAENATDLDGADTGAEAVARFISTRTDGAGSYHSIADSDSVVRLVDYGDEAFHVGVSRGGVRANSISLGLSVAYGSRSMPTGGWWPGALRNAAAEAAAMAAWLLAEHGIVVPDRRITADEFWAGKPGFISHAELDPGRRSDPVGFPWASFLAFFHTATQPTGVTTTVTTTTTELTAELVGDYPTLLDMPKILEAVEAIYDTFTGTVTAATIEQVRAWGRDIARKLVAAQAGTDAGAEAVDSTLRYIAWELNRQHPHA